MEKGKLFIVATPIGNIQDISKRAIDTLLDTDYIACEDTRTTGILLSELGISAKMFSYHEHNKQEASDHIINLLDDGNDVALVSDAGTPCISDPGYVVVKKAREKGFDIVPIPGPSALLSALSVSGFATDAFIFQGFLSTRSVKKRMEKIRELLSYNMTVILYEAPHRMIKLLDEINSIDPNCELFIGREMTKKYEQFMCGTPSLIKSYYEERKPKGEHVVVINKTNMKISLSDDQIKAEFTKQRKSGIPDNIILKDIAKQTGKSKREIYDLCKKKPR